MSRTSSLADNHNVLFGDENIKFHLEMKTLKRCPLDHSHMNHLTETDSMYYMKRQLVYKLETDHHLVFAHAESFLRPLWNSETNAHRVLWFVNLFINKDIRDYFLSAYMARRPFPVLPDYQEFHIVKNRRTIDVWFTHRMRPQWNQLGFTMYRERRLASKPKPKALPSPVPLPPLNVMCFVCQESGPADMLTVKLCRNGHTVHDACGMGLFAMWLVENGAMAGGHLQPEKADEPFPPHSGCCPLCKDIMYSPSQVFDNYLCLYEKYVDRPQAFTGGPPPDTTEFRSTQQLNAELPLFVELTEEEEYELVVDDADMEADWINEVMDADDSDFSPTAAAYQRNCEVVHQRILRRGTVVPMTDSLYNF